MTDPANDPPVAIRRGTASDAETAARLHAELISEGFLARLGPRFLRHLYLCVARGPDSFLLIADADAGTSVAGFLAGALDLRALYRRFVWRHGPAAALSSLPRLLGTLPRVWETLRHGAGAPGPDPGVDHADADHAGTDRAGAAELLSIAVDPRWRGRHIGALLVDGFLGELDHRGVDRAQVVVGADNAPAVALYGRAGFRPAGTFELHRGVSSLVMRRPG